SRKHKRKAYYVSAYIHKIDIASFGRCEPVAIKPIYLPLAGVDTILRNNFRKIIRMKSELVIYFREVVLIRQVSVYCCHTDGVPAAIYLSCANAGRHISPLVCIFYLLFIAYYYDIGAGVCYGTIEDSGRFPVRSVILIAGQHDISYQTLGPVCRNPARNRWRLFIKAV